MSTYLAVGSRDGRLVIKAISYEIRIIQVNLMNFNSTADGSTFFDIHGGLQRYPSSSTMTGGTTIPAGASRGGSPAATAQCKTGTVTLSGTPEVVGEYNATAQSLTSISPPVDVTIPPGSYFLLGGITGLTQWVYFEELRLAWHY